MRGHQSLYKDIFEEGLTAEAGEKGKRNAFIEERDDALAHRFYYHANIIRSRYEDCLFELRREFFLTPNVIIQRLSLRRDLIVSLKEHHVSAGELKRRYPYYNWSGR